MSQGIWEASLQKAEKDNLLGIVIICAATSIAGGKDQTAVDVKLHTALSSVLAPRFDNSGRRNGRFCLSCADRMSLDWLRSAVDTLTINVSENGGTSRQRQLTLADD